MAKVPYSPVPTVSPQATVLPKPSLNAPAEVFGEAEAQAKQGLGNELRKAGNELFGRAVALQNLNNETEAREAATQYMISAGELHAEYMTLQGRDRVNAYQGYAKKLQDLRKKIRASLTNPAAAKMYDSQSMGTMSHSIFNGAGAAASANKKWTSDTVKAQLELDLKSVEDNPNDEAWFQQKLRAVATSASNLAAQEGAGAGSPIERNAILKATSRAWAQRITGMARVEPFKAAKFLDEHKTELTQEDFLRVDQTVRTQGRAVGASNIADTVYSPDKTLEQMEAEAKAQAKKLNPNDPLLDEAALSALRTKYNQTKYAKKQESDAANDHVSMILHEFKPKNMQEFLASEEGWNVFERLTPAQKEALPGRINRYNSAVDKYDQAATLLRLKGMANSDDPEAREAFLNLDPTKEDLSQTQMGQVMDLQRRLRKDVSGDPRVTKAVTWMRGAFASQLEALGIFNRKDNEDEYDRYIGAMQSALDVWLETHKQPATYKDVVDTIGPQILREVTVPGRFFGENQYPLYNIPTYLPGYERFTTDLNAAAVRQGLPPLTEEQVRKMWIKAHYLKLYAKPPEKTQGRAQ